MHVECQGCGSRGPGLSAAGAACSFCGGTFQIVGLPKPGVGIAQVSATQLPALRVEHRTAREQHEQYRRAMYEIENGTRGTSTQVSAFWTNRTDAEHDRLAGRLAAAAALLNQVLASLGLPPEI